MTTPIDMTVKGEGVSQASSLDLKIKKNRKLTNTAVMERMRNFLSPEMNHLFGYPIPGVTILMIFACLVWEDLCSLYKHFIGCTQEWPNVQGKEHSPAALQSGGSKKHQSERNLRSGSSASQAQCCHNLPSSMPLCKKEEAIGHRHGLRALRLV